MDVSSADFHNGVAKIIQQIAESHLIAFDLEFSGVAGRRLPGVTASKFTVQEYYEDLRAAAQKYQILQVGMTVVTEDLENGQYICRPYNFNISPLPTVKESIFQRVWSCNSGAISFLLRHGFRHELPLTQGVHYLSRQEEDYVRQRMVQEQEAKASLPDMTLRKDDDILVEHIRARIQEWQDQPKEKQEPFLNIPAENAKEPIPDVLTRYQVRLVHQTVRNEYPGLKTTGLGHFVQITNPTSDQQKNELDLREQSREREISWAVGFRWLVEAMVGGDISKIPTQYVQSVLPKGAGQAEADDWVKKTQLKLKSKPRVLVGHNCLTDLLNFYRCFIGDLPLKADDFHTEIRKLFPLILDTKYIAGASNNDRWSDTSLKAVEGDVGDEPTPKLYLPKEFVDRCRSTENYHEAGFDSWVTAKIGIKLPARLRRQEIAGTLIRSVRASGTHSAATTSNRGNTLNQQMNATPSTSNTNQDQSASTSTSHVTHTHLPAARTLAVSGTADRGTQPSKDQVPTDDKAGQARSNNPNSVPQAVAAAGAVTRDITQNLVTKADVKKLKTAARRTNMFALLDDDPQEDAEETAAEKEAKKAARVREMIAKGELLPRWDDAVWTMLGNKLQANACQAGVIDLKVDAE